MGRMGRMGRIGRIGRIGPILSPHPMVGVTGLEPVTLRLSSACSNQLSYTPVGWPEVWFGVRQGPPRPAGPVEAWGFEPQTYSLQSYRSTN
jgi:hypothetical protein